MLVTPKFTYLQLQKTGCTHIETLIHHFFKSTQTFGKHFRPAPGFNTKNNFILGSIRNPWDWYLSYWTYSSMGKGGPFQRCTGSRSIYKTIFDSRLKNGRGALKQTPFQYLAAMNAEWQRPIAHWEKCLNSDDPKNFNEWLKTLLDSKRKYDFFQDYGHSSIASFSGLLTYLYVFLYFSNGQSLYSGAINNYKELVAADAEYNCLNSVIRTEHLEDDFIAFLQTIKLTVEEKDIAFIKNLSKKNQSNRLLSIGDYYDKETIEMIYEKDRLIIDKYNYKFPAHA